MVPWDGFGSLELFRVTERHGAGAQKPRREHTAQVAKRTRDFLLYCFGSHLCKKSSNTIWAGFNPSRAKTFHTEPDVMKYGCKQFVPLHFRPKKCPLDIIFNSKNVDSDFRQNPSLSGMVMKGWTTSLHQIIRIKQVDTEFFFVFSIAVMFDGWSQLMVKFQLDLGDLLLLW